MLLSVPGPRVMSEPQGQEDTEPDFECTPRGSSPPSLHLAPGHFSCSACHLRLRYFNSHVTSFVRGELSISLLPRSTAHSDLYPVSSSVTEDLLTSLTGRAKESILPHQNSPFLPVT